MSDDLAAQIAEAEETVAGLRDAWQRSESLAAFHERHPEHPMSVRAETRKSADAWKADLETTELELLNLQATARRRALIESVRVRESDPAARLPFFDVATLISGTYPPEGAEAEDESE